MNAAAQATQTSGRPLPSTLRNVGLFGLVLYAVAAWLLLRPDFLMSWRESDTQTIARHFMEPGSSIFMPRIDWAGTGPGYVEAEFQLYTWLTSLLMRTFGYGEWPGQVVSLLATLGAGAVAFRGLSRVYGPLPALLGACALLASRGVVHCAVLVQPEALCLLLFTAAWFAFTEFAESGSRRQLVIYGVTGALAMLVKPTAAQLGVASVVLLALHARPRLYRADVWVAWVAMVGLLALHLLHARSLFIDYGATFGVLSGGDTKVPKLQYLLAPSLLTSALSNAVMWGVGLIGCAAAVAVLVLDKKRAPIIALTAGVLVWTLVAFRYTSRPAGKHYHLLGAVLAAHAVAQLATLLPQRLAGSRKAGYALGLLGLLLCGQLANSIRVRQWLRQDVYNAPPAEVAAALKRHCRPGDLIVARSYEPEFDREWNTPTNYEDPRIFFLSGTRGWPLGSETDDPRRIEEGKRQGARFFVEPQEHGPTPATDTWLREHARLLETTTFGGKVYAL
jgi:Dolichyl-phosphate-mannose-protein mannosyltransferase